MIQVKPRVQVWSAGRRSQGRQRSLLPALRRQRCSSPQRSLFRVKAGMTKHPPWSGRLWRLKVMIFLSKSQVDRPKPASSSPRGRSAVLLLGTLEGSFAARLSPSSLLRIMRAVVPRQRTPRPLGSLTSAVVPGGRVSARLGQRPPLADSLAAAALPPNRYPRSPTAAGRQVREIQSRRTPWSNQAGCNKFCNNHFKLRSILPVFPIRIHRIHMFLGLPDPDPFVRGMDPDPDPSVIMPEKYENPWFLLFCDSFWLFIFRKLCKCTFKQ